MPRTLIISEKPSVAADLARVLAKAPGMTKFTKDSGGVFFENDSVIITSAVGHLVEQKKPMTAEGKPLPWKLAVLPSIPTQFELEPIERSADRLKKVLKLAKLKEVELIVNACDAGREGELIFRNILRYGDLKKPVKRLWMQSMTDASILEAWAHLRSDEELQSLADAAICRSESDWLIGLNSTRALTALKSRGGFSMTPAGRVQTPTLAILAKREVEIQQFKSRDYYEVHAGFQVSKGKYEGKWIDKEWKKNEKDEHSKPERIWEYEEAVRVCERCKGKTGTVAEETKKAKQTAPMLYDLTSLQREASGRFGFSARRTLQLAQECYEKHKILTYPRTDSRYLPDDYLGTVLGAMKSVIEDGGEYAQYAKIALDKKYVGMNRRVFDTKKVSDHFAIIPTGRFVKLEGDVARLYELVLARFIAVFFPAAEFLDTKRFTRIVHTQDLVDVFRTDGRILLEPGWQLVYGKRVGTVGKDELVPIDQGEASAIERISLKNDQTKPPARYNEATLLSAMEGAGKLVEDEELRDAMSERGLGTPATRAAIIEGLIAQDYVARDGRDLITTRRGVDLIALLRTIGLKTLASPSLTGEWEHKLKQMEHGEIQRESFMKEIKKLTISIVETVRGFQEKLQSVELEELNSICPKCQAVGLKQTIEDFKCRNPECGWYLSKSISGRDLSPEEAKELLEKRIIGPLEGFTSRFGKRFTASLEIDEKFKTKFVFEDNAEKNDVVLTDEQKIAKFSVGKLGEIDIYATEKFYRVPAMVTAKEPKGLSVARTILAKEIPREQFLKMLSEGKSDLLKGFVSQKTKRSFSAFLTLDLKTNKIGFEFEPRDPSRAARPSRASKAEAKKTEKSEKTPAAPKKKPASKTKASTKKK